MREHSIYPFSALVGQEEICDALLVGALSMSLGGVLLEGQRGTAKTTAARALAELLDAPFVEVPLNTQVDRLLGSLELEAALAGRLALQPGLLQAAHGGVVYVDEINLLPEALTSLLVQASSQGGYRLEREGFSLPVRSRFLLVGSMNPEEGELRPQLLDRFGLSIEVAGLLAAEQRRQVVLRRLAFEENPARFCAQAAPAQEQLRARLQQARRHPAALSPAVREEALRLVRQHHLEGHRGEFFLCEAARAWAGWLGKPEAQLEHLERVAPWVLRHRSQLADPPEAPPPPEAQQPPSPPDPPPGARKSGPERRYDADRPDRFEADLQLQARPGSRSREGKLASRQVSSQRGRELAAVRPQRVDPPHQLALTATLMQAILNRPGRPLPLRIEDLRVKKRQRVEQATVVFVVDSSGSMNSQKVMQATKGLVLHWLLHSYQKRHQVCLIGVTRGRAQLVLPPTRSVERARACLQEMVTGGRSPLGQALALAEQVLLGLQHTRMLVILSDGRANLSTQEGLSAPQQVERQALRLAPLGVQTLAVDTEAGPVRLGRMRGLAQLLGARYLTLGQLQPGS